MKEIAELSAARGEDIIGVGGDTTFSIIAGSIVREKKNGVRFGMIGTGSVNDITKGLGYKKAKLIAKAITNSKIKSMDVGCFSINKSNEKIYFLGSLSTGLGSIINEYVESLAVRYPRAIKNPLFLKTFGGYFGVWNSFKNGLVPFPFTIKVNGKVNEFSTSLLVFLNTPLYSGDLLLSPDANPFDGKLDLCILKTGTFLDTFGIFLDVKRKKYKKKDSIIRIRSEEFTVAFDKPWKIQYDGELIKDVTEMNLSISQKKLDIFLPD